MFIFDTPFLIFVILSLSGLFLVAIGVYLTYITQDYFKEPISKLEDINENTKNTVLKGKVTSIDKVRTPFSNKDCVYVKTILKNTLTRKIVFEKELWTPFYLELEDGRVLVIPDKTYENAKVNYVKLPNELTLKYKKNAPHSEDNTKLDHFIKSNIPHKQKSLLSHCEMTEWYVAQESTVLVFGRISPIHFIDTDVTHLISGGTLEQNDKADSKIDRLSDIKQHAITITESRGAFLITQEPYFQVASSLRFHTTKYIVIGLIIIIISLEWLFR